MAAWIKIKHWKEEEEKRKEEESVFTCADEQDWESKFRKMKDHTYVMWMKVTLKIASTQT